MGITGIKVKDYVLGGFGMFPGTILFVYIGTTISNIQDIASGNYDKGYAYIIFIIVGIVVGIGAVVLISIKTKKELNKYLQI